LASAINKEVLKAKQKTLDTVTILLTSCSQSLNKYTCKTELQDFEKSESGIISADAWIDSLQIKKREARKEQGGRRVTFWSQCIWGCA
jgi:hypothetical protein